VSMPLNEGLGHPQATPVRSRDPFTEFTVFVSIMKTIIRVGIGSLESSDEA
jgi:hypothetical protein